MARMSIDDMVLRDPRVIRLARTLTSELGPVERWPDFARRYALGVLLDTWAIAYDRKNHVVPADDLDMAALIDGFHATLVAVGLASNHDEGIHIAGARKRIGYLTDSEDNGREGGKKSGRVRRENATRRTNDEGVHEGVPNPLPTLSPLSPLSPQPRATSPSRSSAQSRDTESGSRKRAPNSVPGFRELIDHFDRRYKAAYNGPPTWGPKTGAQVKRILKHHALDEAIRRCDILFDAPPSWLTEPYDFATYVQHFDKLVAPSRGPRTRQQAQMDNQLDRVRELERQANEPHSYEAGARGECRVCGNTEDHELHDEVPW